VSNIVQHGLPLSFSVTSNSQQCAANANFISNDMRSYRITIRLNPKERMLTEKAFQSDGNLYDNRSEFFRNVLLTAITKISSNGKIKKPNH
jgi:hypothetical protein